MNGTNIRAMSDDERKIGFDLNQALLWKLGDFITKNKIGHMNIGDRQLYERMKQAFLDYNEWLKR